MTLTRRPLVLLSCLTLVATLVVVAAPPASAASARPWPAVWDVVPAPGEVVPAGRTSIAGTATGPAGVRDVTVEVDGAEVPHEIADQNDTAARITAKADLTPGTHVITIRFVGGDDVTTTRNWRVLATELPVDRLAGDDRYETAATIAGRDREAGAADAAVLARGDQFADALAGVPLAHHLDGPLLLTESDRLTSVTAAELQRLVRADGTVHLLGGQTALEESVADSLRSLGFEVVRHEGVDRYATAATIAAQLPPSTSAVVASGRSFPDALAVAGPAAVAGQPILLSEADALPEATQAAIEGLERVLLVGGTAVLADEVGEQADEVAGEVVRIAGADRYATAVRVLDAYDVASDGVSLASGTVFPDALVGALDVARTGGGLLLTAPTRLPEPTRAALVARALDAVTVYGGPVAVSDGVLRMVQATPLASGPAIVEEVPAAVDEIGTLDQISLTFEDSLDLPATSIAVHFDGRELPTRVGTGDFDNHLILTVGALTVDPVLGQPYPVRVVGAVRSDRGWTHVDHLFTYRKTAMSAGDQGDAVLALQQRLVSLGYWLGTPDASYGSLTVQAVMAFQKYEGLPPSGSADDATRQRLDVAQRPVPRSTLEMARSFPTGGFHVQIDKSRQVLFFVRDEATIWLMNTSTGSEIPYDEPGGSGNAVTPTGEFDVCFQRDELRESSLGTLWRPKYFQCERGIAVHGATSVPNYPASHGCVRVTYPAMNFVWEQNLMPMGARVWVYGAIPPR